MPDRIKNHLRFPTMSYTIVAPRFYRGRRPAAIFCERWLFSPTSNDHAHKGARDGDGRKEVDHRTDGQGDGKAFDDAGPKVAAKDVQDGTDDQRGGLRVPDGGPGAVKAGVHGGAQRSPGAQLFFHPFKDQDVGVYGHAGREQETGDAGQGEGDGLEIEHQGGKGQPNAHPQQPVVAPFDEIDDKQDDGQDDHKGAAQLEHGKVEQAIDDQRQVGQQAGQAVVDQHKEQHGAEADDAGLDALLDRFLAQRGADLLVAFDAQRDGQGTVLQLDGQRFGFLALKLAA